MNPMGSITPIKARLLPAALALLLLAAGDVQAQSGRGLRCGRDLVTPGYLKYEVLKSCGEPLAREVVGEVEIVDPKRIYDGNYLRGHSYRRKVILFLEEWIYDRNGLNVLRFEGNRLVQVAPLRPR